MDEEITFSVESIIGLTTRQGLVALTVGDQKMNITPAKAKELGEMLTTAALAAESDEVLYSVLYKLGIEESRIGDILLTIRHRRRARHPK